jgi:hypothetical protein
MMDAERHKSGFHGLSAACGQPQHLCVGRLAVVVGFGVAEELDDDAVLRVRKQLGGRAFDLAIAGGRQVVFIPIKIDPERSYGLDLARSRWRRGGRRRR